MDRYLSAPASSPASALPNPFKFHEKHLALFNLLKVPLHIIIQRGTLTVLMPTGFAPHKSEARVATLAHLFRRSFSNFEACSDSPV